jgi:hypothetical protein
VPTPAFADFVVPQAPQADGSIVHIVQPGDTLSSIAVAYATTNDEILKLNGLASGRFLQIGQKLIIRLAPPGGSSSEAIAEAQGTSEVSATDEVVATGEAGATEEVGEPATTEEATQVPPTIEPTVAAPATDVPPAPVTEVADNSVPSVTQVCLSLFDDANQNRIHEEGESLLAKGTITVSTGGQTVNTYETDGASEPFCLKDVTAGIYVAAAQPPEGYGLTTSPQLTLRVQTGLSIDANFGAAQGVEAVVPPAADSGNEQPQAIINETADTPDTSALLQNIGLIVFGLAGFVLVFGLGAAVLLRRR